MAHHWSHKMECEVTLTHSGLSQLIELAKPFEGNERLSYHNNCQ